MAIFFPPETFPSRGADGTASFILRNITRTEKLTKRMTDRVCKENRELTICCESHEMSSFVGCLLGRGTTTTKNIFGDVHNARKLTTIEPQQPPHHQT
eukprot:scaffold351_cov148-Amphora_coffeaeformis.AAC.3